MEESRAQGLHEILKRLGKALHGSIVNSGEVRACLRELHEKGWDAVMLLEASVVCHEDGRVNAGHAALHIHSDPFETEPGYDITTEDARILRSLGISIGVDPGVRSTPGSDDSTDWQG